MPTLLDLQKANPGATWIDRVLRPEMYPNLWLTGPDGRRETHRLAAEMDEFGNVFIFPTIRLMPDGQLKKYKDNYEAMRDNISVGNAVRWPGDIHSAVEFTRNYKPDSFNAFHGRGLLNIPSN